MKKELHPLEPPPFVKQWNEMALRATKQARLLRRYLDNHSNNADTEGMSALCECKLCQETRNLLSGKPTS